MRYPTVRPAVTLLLVLLVSTAGPAAGERTDAMNEASEAGTTAVAIFAGGCFWCTEADFEKLDGVVEAVSGYTGGRTENPTYDEVCAGGTGHYEAVRVVFDPSRVSYAELLDHFWRHVDPTDPGGQFVDRGEQYRPAVFYTDEGQKRIAEASRAALDESGRFDRPVVAGILPAGPFYPAEEYHQGYYRRCPIRYEMYRKGSGRDRFLEEHGGD